MRIVDRLQHDHRPEMLRFFEIILEQAFQSKLSEQEIIRRFQHPATHPSPACKFLRKIHRIQETLLNRTFLVSRFYGWKWRKRVKGKRRGIRVRADLERAARGGKSKRGGTNTIGGGGSLFNKLPMVLSGVVQLGFQIRSLSGRRRRRLVWEWEERA